MPTTNNCVVSPHIAFLEYWSYTRVPIKINLTTETEVISVLITVCYKELCFFHDSFHITTLIQTIFYIQNNLNPKNHIRENTVS